MRKHKRKSSPMGNHVIILESDFHNHISNVFADKQMNIVYDHLGNNEDV